MKTEILSTNQSDFRHQVVSDVLHALECIEHRQKQHGHNPFFKLKLATYSIKKQIYLFKLGKYILNFV